MGFVGFLKFLLLCSDLLAWPVLALGYPLCASIRAIETGSKCHMRKLVIYWTLFSLFSLFELAFVKIIEWIPYWSCTRLVCICWLVTPGFNGACYVYESLLHPCLLLRLQPVMGKLYKTKEDKPVMKTEFFLDVAEKYINLNGPDALEKLIASRKTLQNQIMGTWAGKKPDAPADIKEMAQPNLGTWYGKKPDAPADIKEMAASEAHEAESSCPETLPPKQVQREWTCALCSVTTTSEKTLNAHFLGSRHKFNCEQSKISKNTPKGTVSSPLMKDKANKAKPEAVKKPAGDGLLPKQLNRAKRRIRARMANKHTIGEHDGAASHTAMAKHDGAASHTSKPTCLVCGVKVLSDIDLQSHFKGKRHLSNIDKMKAGTSK